MSLRIETLSHGEIEGGFFSMYTRGFRFGSHAFSTQNVHGALRYLAEREKSLALNIPDFGVDAFWEDFEGYVSQVGQNYFELFDPSLELTAGDFEKFIAESQGREIARKLAKNLTMVPIRISDDERAISVGQYRIDGPTFRGMADYVVNGGWFGWSNGLYPPEALRAKEAIKKSSRPLYSDKD